MNLGDVNYTEDGIEKQFGVNHVGHALLYHLLQKEGCLAEDVRIVITSSGSHDPEEKWGTLKASIIDFYACNTLDTFANSESTLYRQVSNLDDSGRNRTTGRGEQEEEGWHGSVRRE
jgi:NAD(P)-dependent dehydrogenase (short-subunit alcohol dehydrogenase family)